MISFQTTCLDSIPCLAWCAKFDRKKKTFVLLHGSEVVTSEGKFVEGCWDGDFGELDFMGAEVMCGSGGVVDGNSIALRGSTDRLAPLMSVKKGGLVLVSNSITFLLTQAEEKLDPVYPYYPYDMIKIWRQGDHCSAGKLPLKSSSFLQIHFGTIVQIDLQGTVSYETPMAGDTPQDFTHYRKILAAKSQVVLANARDSKREMGYSSLAALTKGYDASATSVLAKQAGCEEVFSFTDSHQSNPAEDSGRESAQQLNMKYHEFDRWDFMDMEPDVVAELSLFALSSNAPMAALESLVRQKVLITGNRGDIMWSLDKAAVHQNMEHTWARFLSGVNMMEFRLRIGFFIFSPCTILERQCEAIHEISNSEEMRPWRVNTDYDRPIPRRIAEEGGLARESFGVKKMGTGHFGFRYDGNDDTPIKQAYGQFLALSQQEASAVKLRCWKLRYQLDQLIWNRLTPNQKKVVRSNQWQRLFPYICNISPMKLDWYSSFTLQWAISSLSASYLVYR